MTEPAKRFTLRQLPLPAKLVATLFLLTVGLGYSSAMVQLHFQHTRADGKPMPMVEDVVEIFAGKKWVVPDGSEPPRAVCKLEKLIMGPVKGSPFNGSGSMAPAFFDRCPIYRAALIGRNRQPLDVAGKAKLDAEREGERLALQLWINTPEAERKAAYEADKFVPPVGRAPKSITPQFTHEGNSGYKVKSLLTARCTGCHGKGGEQEQFSLETYEQLAEYMAVPAAPDTIPPGGAWCASDRQISKEKLAQSTHAHLLSFAMLFSLTGLIFAFTSYPLSVRCVLGPLVLLAQVADVSCWWLARLDGPGPYFAMCIIGTGGVVGLGLITQIVLSTFNMYGAKGKLVLGGLFATGLVLGGLVYVKVVRPHLEEERKQAAEKTKAAEQPTEPAPPKSGPQQEPKAASPSKLEKLLTGQFVPKGPFNKDANGGMIRAFFDKEPDFKDALKNKDPDLPRLTAEREGEQN
ncbi:MAG TPA: hypothetical protein VKE74_17840, partial [Gemmataceae bacterium]|nr:hypothetical protein [Gemmataceae bacterium]